MTVARVDWTREELIDICERAVVAQEKWANRDSHEAHLNIGQAWVLLQAGCEFTIRVAGKGDVCTNERTIWVDISARGFASFDCGGLPDTELFYLPTPERLDSTSGKDWY